MSEERAAYRAAGPAETPRPAWLKQATAIRESLIQSETRAIVAKLDDTLSWLRSLLPEGVTEIEGGYRSNPRTCDTVIYLRVRIADGIAADICSSGDGYFGVHHPGYCRAGGAETAESLLLELLDFYETYLSEARYYRAMTQITDRLLGL